MIITGWLVRRIENARNANVLEAGFTVSELNRMIKFTLILIAQTAAPIITFGSLVKGLNK
jgi:hypothetical protein